MSDITDKVQKLLDKAASLSAMEDVHYQQEAEAILAKATAMMVEYGISNGLLAAKAKVTLKPTHRMFYAANPFAPAKTSLLTVIGKTLGCYTVLTKNAARNDGVAECHVFGYQDDLDSLEILFVSAQLIAMRGAERQKRLGKTSRGFQSSYWTGFYIGIREQLNTAAEQVKQASQASDAGTNIMLRDRALAVNGLVNETYPRLRKIQRSYSNSEGFNTGKADGRNANLTQSSNISSTGQRMIG